MRNLTTAIYGKISGSQFETDIAGRFFKGRAPEGAEYPYAVALLVSDSPENVFGGRGEDVIIQFSLFSSASSSSEIEDMFSHLTSLFDDCAMTITNETMIYMERVDAQLMVEDEDTPSGTQQIWHYSVDYSISLEVPYTGEYTADGNWDLGAGRALLTERVQARSNLGLSLFEDGGKGIVIEDLTGFSRAERIYEDQPFSYLGKKISIVNPYVTKTNSYKGQLHCHTTNSDGFDTPADMMTAYKNAGYDFAAITDHDFLTPDPGVPGILFVSGVEESTDGGHMGSIGPTVHQVITATQAVIDAILADGAIPIINHPNWILGPWTDIELESVDSYIGIEIWNHVVPPNENAEDKWDTALTKGIKAFGVSCDDAHHATDTNHGWTIIFSDSLTVASIKDALKRGNFYSSTGPTLTVSLAGKVITATTGAASTIAFIGTGGSVLQTTASVTTASYTILGSERYVRIKITRDSDSKNAWSNPIWVDLLSTSELKTGGAVARDLRIYGNLRSPLIFGDLGDALKAIDLSASGMAGASEYYLYNSATDYWRADGKAKFSSNIVVGAGMFEFTGQLLYAPNFRLRGGPGETLNFAAYEGHVSLLASHVTGGNYNVNIVPSGLGNTIIGPGNVGIGTTSPLTKLHIVGTGEQDLALYSVGGTSEFQGRRSDGTLAVPTNPPSGAGLFAISGYCYVSGSWVKSAEVEGILTSSTYTTRPPTALGFFASLVDEAGMRQGFSVHPRGATVGPSYLNNLTPIGGQPTTLTVYNTGGPNAVAEIASKDVAATGAIGTIVFTHAHGAGPTYDELSRIVCYRSGGDNSGRLGFLTCNAGAEIEKFTILPSGNIGVNDLVPAEKLDVDGNINVTGVYKVADVQVLKSRVVDARIDDTINAVAWDATTAGVLTAIRDALVSHGIVAAA